MKKSIEKETCCECCGQPERWEMISQREFIKECGREALKDLLEDGYYDGENDETYRYLKPKSAKRKANLKKVKR